MDDARQHERRRVSLRPRYRVATRLDYTESACLDLSEGGMFIESTAPAAPGTLVKLECDGEHGVFRALGTVAWRRGAGEAPAGMGIRFLKLEPGGSDVLQRVLASASGGAVALPAHEARITWMMIAATLMMLVGGLIVFLGSR